VLSKFVHLIRRGQLTNRNHGVYIVPEFTERNRSRPHVKATAVSWRPREIIQYVQNSQSHR
jgi:hypothetical protein